MWFVYLLTCADRTLYCGITTDIDRRIQQHNAGTGAKYVRPRRPVRLSYYEKAASRSEASKREAAIKKLSREEKMRLISFWP
jgi:putative endonuclease